MASLCQLISSTCRATSVHGKHWPRLFPKAVSPLGHGEKNYITTPLISLAGRSVALNHSFSAERGPYYILQLAVTDTPQLSYTAITIVAVKPHEYIKLTGAYSLLLYD